MSCKFHKAIFHAALAAALYAVSIPFSKLLLVEERRLANGCGLPLR